MLALQEQTSLTELNLQDCVKLTDEGVACFQGKSLVMPIHIWPSPLVGQTSCVHAW